MGYTGQRHGKSILHSENLAGRNLITLKMDADLIELLTSNLSRLDENSDTDRAGVYYILGVLENLSSQPALAEKIGQDASVLSISWDTVGSGNRTQSR